MIENDEIRTQVAAKSVDTLFENVDVEAAIAERLPPAQQGLAPVLAGLARSGADRAADAALERPRVQTVWVEVTTRTQRQLVRLLDDDTTFIQTEGGAVVLDLRPLVIQLGDQVAVIGKVAERLPESTGRIAIIEKSQLETAQTATKLLRTVADWMWLVALAVAALAIWLARGRRRLELRALAIGLVVVGLLMLAVRRFAGDYLVDELVKDDAVKPAAHDAWSILTQILADRAWVWIILGVVTLVGVWFVGDTVVPLERAAPPRLSCESRPTTYGIAAGALLALVLVAPPIARGWLIGARPDRPRRRRNRGRARDRPAGDPAARLGGTVSARPRNVIKGGSHLCAPNYCLRYRPEQSVRDLRARARRSPARRASTPSRTPRAPLRGARRAPSLPLDRSAEPLWPRLRLSRRRGRPARRPPARAAEHRPPLPYGGV